MSARGAKVLALAATLLVVAGFAGGSHASHRDPEETIGSTMDLADAKQQTLAWTSLLVAAVPAEVVAESWQNAEGVLMSCSEEAFQWASAAEVIVKEQQDLVPLLERMSTAWTAETGLPASFEKAGRGGPRLVVEGPGHAIIIIDAYDDGRHIALSSFSACVTDLADYDGGNTY
ncbi:hypothetical protein GCM10027282_03890 [Frigoribacterium salinisoli]